MINVEKIMCFTGHRTEKLPKTSQELLYLREQVRQEVLNALEVGHNTFMTGMCYGFDLLCADVVLCEREIEPLNLVAVVPFRQQTKGWGQSDIGDYQRILSRCDSVVVLQEHYSSGCYYRRNEYMVNSSQRVLAYCLGSGGTQHTINYAQKRGIDVINLHHRLENFRNQQKGEYLQ